MQPAYLSMILAIPPCAASALTEAQNGLDKRIIRQAEARGMAVRALEPYHVLFDIFAGMSDTDQRDMLKISLAMDDQSEDAFATMQDSYFSEDSRMIWEFSRWQTLQAPGFDPAGLEADFAMMEEALLTTRNRAWIPVIEAALADGIKVFGHKSPDTDSTGSPIIWAWYLTNVQGTPATPVLLGEPNTEAAFVLRHWGLEKPAIIADVTADDTCVIVDTNNPAELPASINDAKVVGIIDHHCWRRAQDEIAHRHHHPPAGLHRHHHA
jgi:hypothetical protein